MIYSDYTPLPEPTIIVTSDEKGVYHIRLIFEGTIKVPKDNKEKEGIMIFDLKNK